MTENIHVIPSKKFKTVTIVAKFKTDLARETITQRALVPFLLQQGTTSYPTEKQLNLKLNELYGAVFNVSASKKGNHHIITIHLEVANQKYIENESTIMDEALDLLKEVIHAPNVENGAFPTAVFEREKATLQSRIKSIIDDKISYANQRLIDEMCADEAFSIHTNGYEADLADLTSADVYAYYQKMLTEDQFDIYVIGDFDETGMREKIKAHLPVKSQNTTDQANVEKQKTIDKVAVVKQSQEIQQAKLHIGFRTNTAYQDEDYYALQIFNGLFGGFPSSKLFVNVREKHSLAYYVGSRLESHKGLLIVLSGIAIADYEKAKTIIEEQFNAMLAGDFTDENVSATKDLVISQILEAEDSARGTIELLYDQVVASKEQSLDDYRAKLAQVTKAEVIAVAQKVQMDTIYLLTNEGADTDE